ncbi:MAG: NAD(P)H-dependent oxidoreductase subunit E [Candidatus Kapabacteria bacterium]|nr:NAD(P)H-dependent oxidoreductase subunit E [Ignavibacteriota bacterium]MCW5884449.1 NAD(P)H-dependent oxidoreductase subunit E [Candidatus Kapabacteria bacterium]
MCNSSNENIRKFQKVCEILEFYDYDKSKLIPILQAVQDEYRYLPEEIMVLIASSLDISPAKVYGVATFFSHFALEPKGKYVIKVCDGTACHVKNSEPIIKEIRLQLNLTPEKPTTPDMMFTLETVSCLGACGLAPVVVINEVVHSLMTPKKIAKEINKIMESEVEYA